MNMPSMPPPPPGVPPPPPPAGPPAEGTSQRATLSLVLGILGVVCCQLTGPVAWYFGRAELAAIAAGASPRSGEGVAKAGMILGIIGTILLGLGLVWFFFAGFAILMGLLQQGV